MLSDRLEVTVSSVKDWWRLAATHPVRQRGSLSMAMPGRISIFFLCSCRTGTVSVLQRYNERQGVIPLEEDEVLAAWTCGAQMPLVLGSYNELHPLGEFFSAVKA